MSVKIAVVTAEPGAARQVELDDEVIVPTLGESDAGNLAVRLDELLRSIAETVEKSISAEADLTVEVTGAVTLSGKAEVKWLFFNVGGGAKTTDTLKVVLKTKIYPPEE